VAARRLLVGSYALSDWLPPNRAFRYLSELMHLGVSQHAKSCLRLGINERNADIGVSGVIGLFRPNRRNAGRIGQARDLESV
jgi:hypothetical protein